MPPPFSARKICEYCLLPFSSTHVTITTWTLLLPMTKLPSSGVGAQSVCVVVGSNGTSDLVMGRCSNLSLLS